MILTLDNWESLLHDGYEMNTSGTTGEKKRIFQPPDKLDSANLVALEVQGITKGSRILTVGDMARAAGALAQTLPALCIGAKVSIQEFDALKFCEEVRAFTHTHLSPEQCEAIQKTASFAEANFDGLFLTIGGDNLSFDIIKALVGRGATVMSNWGMTEIGPIAINTIFRTVEQVEEYRQQAIPTGTLMGDQYHCDYRVKDGCLFVKGSTCVTDGWFNTRDLVAVNDQGAMYHLGRGA